MDLATAPILPSLELATAPVPATAILGDVDDISDLSDLGEMPSSDDEADNQPGGTMPNRAGAALSASFGQDEAEDDFSSLPPMTKKRALGSSRKPVASGRHKVTAQVVSAPVDEVKLKAKQFMDDIEMQIKSSSRTRRPNSSSIDVARESQHDEIAFRFVANMLEAARQDREAFDNGHPGLAKVMMLQKVRAVFSRGYMHANLLEQNLLSAIRAWLDPFRDASLPSVDIQRDMLKMLERFHIDRDQLQESGVGKVVMFYTKVPTVTPDVREMADRLVAKWSRLVLGRSDNYREQPRQSVAMSTARHTASASTLSRVNPFSAEPVASSTLSVHSSAPLHRQRAAIPRPYVPPVPVAPLPSAEVQDMLDRPKKRNTTKFKSASLQAVLSKSRRR